MEGFRVFFTKQDGLAAMFEVDLPKDALSHIVADGVKKLLSDNGISYSQFKLVLPSERITDGRAIEIDEADQQRILELFKEV